MSDIVNILSKEQSEAAQRWLANPTPMRFSPRPMSAGDSLLEMGRQLERDIAFHMEVQERGLILSKA